MTDLNPFSQACKQHGVIANDVATADNGKANLVVASPAGLALPTQDSVLRPCPAAGLGNQLSHAQRGSRRRIHLVSMMCLGDLNVVALQQLEGYIDTQAHIWGEDESIALAKGLN